LTIGCFYQHFIKTKLKQFKECKDREIHTECLYWFTLHQELHPVPRNHWVFHYVTNNKLQITHTHTKEVILNPSRTFTSFGYNTTQIRTLSDSVQHQIFTEIEIKERKEYNTPDTITNWIEIIHNSLIPLLAKNPKP